MPSSLEKLRKRTHASARNADEVDLQGAHYGQVRTVGSTGICAQRVAVDSGRVHDPDDPPNPGFGEARRHYRPREKLRWPVVVAVAPAVEPAGAFTGTTLAMTHGVSVAGAFIESDLVVPVGQALRLWLHPPAPHPPGLPEVLRLSVQVRWQNLLPARGLPRGFGVQFRAVTSTDEITLHTYFSAHHKVV